MLKPGALVRFCLLSGIKRTWLIAAQMSAYDPKRTCVAALLLNQSDHLLASNEVRDLSLAIMRICWHLTSRTCC